MKPSCADSVNITTQFTLEALDCRYPLTLWKVKSQSSSSYYTSNILTNQCTCEHWMRRLWDKPEEQRICKHIRVAREQALTEYLKDLKKRY